MNNIRVVDDIVRESEQLMSDFYGDQETSYVFTADHGMSKIGNHGDGGIVSPLATSLAPSSRAL
jgi:phosphatidylinositol glycan class N